MDALMSFQLQISLLTACLLANTVQPKLLTEGAEEFLFMVTDKCVYLCFMKCNLSPEIGPLVSVRQARSSSNTF